MSACITFCHLHSGRRPDNFCAPYPGVTQEEMTALYELLALFLQNMETGLERELQVLRQSPKIGQSDSTFAVDRDQDARVSRTILQACGLPMHEELALIFKDTHGLPFQVLSDPAVDLRSLSPSLPSASAKKMTFVGELGVCCRIADCVWFLLSAAR